MFHALRPSRLLAIAAFLLFALFSSTSFAVPISYGTGVGTAEVLFNWPDGFVADYTIHFGTSASSTIDVYDATQLASGDPNLALTWVNDPFDGVDPDYELTIASYTGGHTGDVATYSYPDAQNNFWAEWIDNGSGWNFGDGASVDTVGNGDRIGWVFGNDGTPVPEPTTISLILIGAETLLKRRPLRRATTALGLMAATGACLFSSNAKAADSASVVPGTLVQGSVKSSLGAGTTYDVETNNLGDWPLNTGTAGGNIDAVSITNPDFNGNSFGGTPNTMIAFGSGGGVTLHLASPITPIHGEKDLGIFTAQALGTANGAFFNSNMQAAILVSADDANWYTLTGSLVPSPITYIATTYPLNAPTVAYDFGTLQQAWNDGSPGTTQANLNLLNIANYTQPMPNDDAFNGSGTNSTRLSMASDSTPADYSAIFGTSGGGNWFDISGSGLAAVNYVRLNGDTSVPSSGGIRLDAVFANANAVPEPAALGVIALGGLAFLKRRH